MDAITKKEECNSIEKERKQIIDDYNKLYENKVSDISEVLDILSEEFDKIYSRLLDAQMAYDELYYEYEDVMKDHCFVYNLSGDSTWSVLTGDNYNDENDTEYINKAREIYPDYKIEAIDDVLSIMEIDVENTMCNVGCDMFTALDLILEEDFPEFYREGIFEISGADEEPRIELL